MLIDGDFLKITLCAGVRLLVGAGAIRGESEAFEDLREFINHYFIVAASVDEF